MSARVDVSTRQEGWAEGVRRLYFYAVLGVSYGLGVWAFNGLLRTLLLALPGFRQEAVIAGGTFLRNQVALHAGTLLVVAPVFWIHWLWVQRRTARLAGERGSTLRKLFLYVALGLSIGIAFRAAYDLLVLGVNTLLQLPPELLGARKAVPWSYHLLRIVLYAAAARAWMGYLAADRDLGTESGWAGTVRRLFQAGVGVTGLALALIGGRELLIIGLRGLLGTVAPEAILVPEWRGSFGENVARLLLGILLWRGNWQRWNGFVAIHPQEARTALRRLYLYVATVISAVLTLAPATRLLREILLILFQVETTRDLVWFASPLASILVGGIAWRWHWRVVQAEAARYGETPESETVRRIYYYLVSATGLVVLWVGLVDLVRVLLDWLVIQEAAEAGFRIRQAANGLSLIAVGLPVWGVHWHTMQRIARLPDERGLRERASTPRRAYLYGVALAGALLILVDLGRFLYQLLLLMLGGPGDPFGGETLNALVRSGLALLFWVAHVLALRGDQRLGTRLEPSPEEQRAARRAELRERIRRLEEELATLRAELERLS